MWFMTTILYSEGWGWPGQCSPQVPEGSGSRNKEARAYGRLPTWNWNHLWLLMRGARLERWRRGGHGHWWGRCLSSHCSHLGPAYECSLTPMLPCFSKHLWDSEGLLLPYFRSKWSLLGIVGLGQDFWITLKHWNTSHHFGKIFQKMATLTCVFTFVQRPFTESLMKMLTLCEWLITTIFPRGKNTP